MDSGEALHDDGAPPQVSWLQGGMFSAGALSVVLISDHHPVHAFGLDYTDNKDQGKNVNCRQEWTEQTNKGEERHVYEHRGDSTSGQTHLVVAGHIWHTSVLSCQLVLNLVDGIVLNVYGTDQQIVGDVVQMTAEFEPGAGGTDVVGGALSLHLQQRRSQ